MNPRWQVSGWIWNGQAVRFCNAIQNQNALSNKFHMSTVILIYKSNIFVLKRNKYQTLANQGPDSRFILEVIIKALIFKSSGSLIMIILNNDTYFDQLFMCCVIVYSNQLLVGSSYTVISYHDNLT